MVTCYFIILYGRDGGVLECASNDTVNSAMEITDFEGEKSSPGPFARELVWLISYGSLSWLPFPPTFGDLDYT